MDELVRQKAVVAFRNGVYSDEYNVLMNAWVDALCLRKDVRPPVENEVFRNGIQLVLQSVKGRNYRYVPLSKFVQAQFCIDPEPLREKILAEIRIQSKALDEAKILDPYLPNIDPDKVGKEDK